MGTSEHLTTKTSKGSDRKKAWAVTFYLQEYVCHGSETYWDSTYIGCKAGWSNQQAGWFNVLRGYLSHELYHSSPGSHLRATYWCKLLRSSSRKSVYQLYPGSFCIQITSYWLLITLRNDRKDMPSIQWRISRSTRPCSRTCAILTLKRSSYVSLGRSSVQAHTVRHWYTEIHGMETSFENLPGPTATVRITICKHGNYCSGHGHTQPGWSGGTGGRLFCVKAP